MAKRVCGTGFETVGVNCLFTLFIESDLGGNSEWDFECLAPRLKKFLALIYF